MPQPVTTAPDGSIIGRLNRVLVSPVLGSDSPSILDYGHKGDIPGYTCNILRHPQQRTRPSWSSPTAPVWATPRTGSQDVIHIMSGLQSKVDFIATATQAAEVYLPHYVKDSQAPLENNRGPQTALPTLGDFIGIYVMDDLDIASLEVALGPEDSDSLQMMANGCRDQAMPLRHYNHDVFSYLPDRYDECLKRGLDRTQWPAFLISSVPDDEGRVRGFGWKQDGVDTSFSRRG